MEQLWIPAGEGNSEYIEKKSRFLGLVLPVTTEAEARAQLEAVKKREYDARHNCWAYVLHTGQKLQRRWRAAGHRRTADPERARA